MRLGTGVRRGSGVALAMVLVAMPAAAPGQDAAVADPATPRVAGTAAEFVLAINAFAAVPRAAVDATLLSASGSQRSCAGVCALQLPFQLPAGAQLIGIELDAIDTNASGQVAALLERCAIGAVSCTTLTSVATGGPAMPGSVQLRADLSSPPTVDNAGFTYKSRVDISGGTPATSFGGVRVFYRLQVSPAPAVATFTDVPVSHPFFRFVQALADAGITSGCGSGNFCPDAPLTRGQMAVFLAIGLGLHFAP